MRKLITFLVLTSFCYAQTQGNRIDVYQSAGDGVDLQSSSNTSFPIDVTAGHFYLGCLNWDDTTQSPTVGDNIGNTYTQGTIFNVGPGTHQAGRFFYGIASNSGTATFSTNLSSGTIGPANLTILDITNDVSATVDGTQQNSSYFGQPNNTTVVLSNSYTTSTNGSIIYSCATGRSGTAAFLAGISPHEQGANSSGTAGSDGGIFKINTGVAGTYTPQIAAVGNSQYTMMSIAFAPASIVLTDTQLPDGATSQTYSATLHAQGGTHAYTFGCSGLPSGLSLNTSTGKITGTPGSVGKFSSIVCNVTDGVVTSGNVTYTINIGSSLATPTFISSSTSTVGETWSFTVPPLPRGAVIIAEMSAMRSATTSYDAPTIGMTDTNSISFTRVSPYENARLAGLVTYVGVNCIAGTDTVQFQTADKGVGSPIASSVEVWTGVQPVIDSGVGQATVWSDNLSHTNTTPSYTPPVSNGVLQAVAITGFTSAGTLTMSMSGTFTQRNNVTSAFGQLISGFLNVGSPVATTVSSTSTDSSSQHEGNSIMMFYLRPAISGISTACGDIPVANNISHVVNMY